MKKELTYLTQLKVRRPWRGPRFADIAVVSMLSDNDQYWLQGSIEVLLKTGKKIVLNKGVYMDKELNTLTGTELRV